MNRNGFIEVICGSMFSGKSEKLIRKIRRAQIARMKTQVFKHAIDDRYSDADVVSHDKLSMGAIPIRESTEIFNHLKPDTEVVGIDEAEFFGPEIVDVCQTLADKGLQVIVAGLDQDFRGEPFGSIPELLAVAEKVEKLQAVCMLCNNTASRSQRLIDGSPAHYNDRTIMLGGKETYEARCRTCHDVPGHPRNGKDFLNPALKLKSGIKQGGGVMSKKLVAIAGNIGAGKSTLTSLLCKKMECRPFYEVVVDANHYLEDFYKDKARYGFALQVFFLSKRFKHLQETRGVEDSAIFDRTIFEDRFIFAQNLYNRGEISERDWNNYCNLFSIMEPFLPRTDLIIYLSIPPEVAYKRIKERDRKEEKDMIPIEYLRQLDNLYADWIEKVDFCPVLHIDAVKYDPRTNPEHLDEITNMVRETLYPAESVGVLCPVNA